MIRITVLAATLALIASAASAQSYHQGYVTRNGTYVAPHWQSSPNGTTTDNWSVRPNVNPFTGQPGTRAPSDGYAPTTPRYGAPAVPSYPSYNPGLGQRRY